MSVKNLGFILETAVEKLKGTIDYVKIFFLCFREVLGLRNGGWVLCEKYCVKECLGVKLRALVTICSQWKQMETMQKLGEKTQTSLFETVAEALRDGYGDRCILG